MVTKHAGPRAQGMSYKVTHSQVDGEDQRANTPSL
jgi:hypothetical protein